MKIKIFITGGTIDDLDYDSIEKAPVNHQSLIPNILKVARITEDYTFEVLMQKDSKFVVDIDREFILKKCQECEERKIIITHGTMTTPETARYLDNHKLPKTIVLTGAAIPANKENSDAAFNLGAAFMAVQIFPTGVYVSMNGKSFKAAEVKKNLNTGYFETI